jgi:N-acetylmuramoyl-L-alanine amidase
MKILIDAGHGGYDIHAGYVTPGKRSHAGEKGTIFEGVSNRAFAHDLCYQLTLRGVDAEVLSPPTVDTPLAARVREINAKVNDDPSKYLLLSIHSNALAGVEGDHGGFEMFTTEGETLSDQYAHKIGSYLAPRYPTIPWRRGLKGKYDKEKDWYIIKYTRCPAILLELLFMDGRQDYEKLTNPQWRTQLITILADSLTRRPLE